MRFHVDKWFDGLIIGLIGLALTLFGFFASAIGLFDAVDNVALDVLLRLRAQKFSPSQDIVLLAMDHESIAYARENPQLGIHSRILPRRYLAQIVDYLREEGARALVFDVEFKLPQTPEDDEALRRALAKIPRDRLFLAARSDTPFDDAYQAYKTTLPLVTRAIPLPGGLSIPLVTSQHDVPRTREALLQDEITLRERVLLPAIALRAARADAVLTRLTENRSKNEKHLSGADFAAFTLEISPQAWTQLRRDALNAWVSARDSIGYDYTGAAAMSVEEQLYNAYENDICLQRNYHRFYDPGDSYLSFLARDGLAVSMAPHTPREARRRLAYCFTDTIQPAFRLPNAHLGITNVQYERDAFERTVPVLKRLYNGSFHTYLGIRPGLTLRGARHLAYDGQTFQADNQRMPLLKNQNALINWRDPAQLPREILSRAYFDMRLLSADALPAARLNAALPATRPLEWHAIASAGFLSPGAPAWDSPENALKDWRRLQDQARAFYASRPPDALRRAFQGDYAPMSAINAFHPDKVDYQPALGNAHLYRKLSVSDVLRQITATRSGGDAAPIYRLKGMPLSGDFSFKNKIVIYGDTMDDIHRTPMGVVFGPEVVATVLDMTLHDRQFVAFAPLWLSFLIVFLICAPLVWICLKLDGLPAIVFTSLFIILGYFTGVVAFFMRDGGDVAYYAPLFGPTLTLLSAFIGALVYRHAVQNREKRMLTHAFSRYVSPQLMTAILNDPARVMENLKGGKRELTVLFADLRNFTSTFEDEDPEKMVDQLNEYFDVMTNIILARKGTYDKYMGDAIMAFFGAPVPFDDHALKACQASMEMCEALKTLNAKWTAEGKTELGIGVGLSTGEMFVGNFGSQRIKNFTVMGSVVNLGARLETFTRQAGVDVVISQRTYEQAQPLVSVKPLGEIRVKGFSEPVQAFGLLAAREAPERSEQP